MHFAVFPLTGACGLESTGMEVEDRGHAKDANIVLDWRTRAFMRRSRMGHDEILRFKLSFPFMDAKMCTLDTIKEIKNETHRMGRK